MPELHSIEAWMMSVITNPHSINAGAASPRSRHGINVSGNAFHRVVQETLAWPAAARLEVYRNAYFTRLTDCLREDFPVLKMTLGEDMFDHFVMDYLRAYPPSSYTLGVLGTHLPRYLRESRPMRNTSTNEPDWADFLADLAELEWLTTEVFDGPGIENTHGSLAPSLRQDAGESDLDVQCSPSLRLSRFQFPVRSYYASVKSGDMVPLPQPATTCVALVRQNFRVRHFDLSPREFELLSRLQAGLSLAAAIESLDQPGTPVTDEISEAWIGECFARWTHAGFLTGLSGLG